MIAFVDLLNYLYLVFEILTADKFHVFMLAPSFFHVNDFFKFLKSLANFIK